MSRIHRLPEQLYNRIAAGEVVERPASVLKELLENALDAHAGKISAQIRKAGTDLIGVTDDGDGMDPEDAQLCFEAHATSKIARESDLNAIVTMGFRGEALPSIASVAKVTLSTRTRESPAGCEIVVHGGKIISAAPAGCPPGTQVVVRDLFYNTPARKKFLRSRGTEERHIGEMMTNLALAHAGIAFELTIDGREFISSPAAPDLTLRIRALFGRDYADALLPLSAGENGVGVSGFIARRSFTRPTRTEQRLFVNGRPVESPGLYRAIREGCGPVLDKGRYQPCILFVTLDPAKVDVNVHPAKREVRFAREFEVVAAVRAAVAEAMRRSGGPAADSLGPAIRLSAGAPGGENPLSAGVMFNPDAVAPAPFAAMRNAPAFPAPADTNTPAAFPPPDQEHPGKDNVSVVDQVLRSAFLNYTPLTGLRGVCRASELPGLTPEPATPVPDREQTAETVPPATENKLGLRIIGILNNTYIVAEKTDGLVLIDQHAAHERVLFEKILRGSGDSLSQRLLIPVTLELSRAEITFVRRNASVMEKLGFEAEPFGSNTVKLNAVPAALRQESAGVMFRDMLANLVENGTPGGRVDYEQVAMSACKAAVKANDVLTRKEALTLLRQLADCELPFACPHGRPTILNISTREIERRFGRR